MSVLFCAIRPCNDLDTIVANGRKQTVLHLFLDAALKTVAYLRVSTRSQDLASQKLAILESTPVLATLWHRSSLGGPACSVTFQSQSNREPLSIDRGFPVSLEHDVFARFGPAPARHRSARHAGRSQQGVCRKVRSHR